MQPVTNRGTNTTLGQKPIVKPSKTISDIPSSVCHKILKQLSRSDLQTALVANQFFYTSFHRLHLQSVQTLCNMQMFFRRIGFDCPATIPKTPLAAMSVYNKAIARLSEVNQTLPVGLRYSNIVIDETELKTFFITVHNYYLKACFGNIAKVPDNIDLNESTRQIRSWLAKPTEIITNLNIEDLNLFYIPSEIGRLTSLRILRASNNHIRSLPIEIFTLNKLTHLKLDNNELSYIPQMISYLKQLQYLNLNSNRLSHISSEIGGLNKITQLCLCCNQLTSLPPEIGRMNALIGLYLTGNKLSSIPPTVENLKNLDEIILDPNLVHLLPQGMQHKKNYT